MKKHVMAITYEPKKDGVFDGRCKQTIRKGDKISDGDEILFHDWEGLPYRSKWNKRKRITVYTVENILITQTGIRFYDSLRCIYRNTTWNSFWVDALAIQDFIDPPTGEALRNVLFGLNCAPNKPEKYQIIRW